MEIPVVSYARFSSQNQRETSIEIQQEHINQFCRENRFSIIKEYVDRAQSATTDNRPQFQQMIADAATGLFKAVVVYNSSRFCRNIQDHLKYKAILESYGVRILSVQEGFDETTPEGDLMNNFMMSINQYYSKDLSRKIYLGCLESAKKGLHVGGPAPYGFVVTKDKHFEINEQEAEVVRIMFKKVAEGETYSAVADYLNKHGYRRRDGTLFTPYLFDLLTNRKYIGEYIWNKTRKKNAFGNRVSRLYKDEEDIIRIPNGLPQIVDEQTFNKVQEAIANRKNNRHLNAPGKFLLSSLVVCDSCGYKMSGDRNINANGKRNYTRINYRCQSMRMRHIDCGKKTINAPRLENYIINLVNATLINPAFSRELTKVMRKKIGTEYDIISAKIAEKKKEIKTINETIDDLMQVISNAKTVAYQELLRAIEKNNIRRNKCEEELKILQEQLVIKPIIRDEFVTRKMSKFRRAVADNKLESLKKMLRILIKEIRVGQEEIRTIINLNPFLNLPINTNPTMTIVESRSNIEYLENQSKLALTWAMLSIE